MNILLQRRQARSFAATATGSNGPIVFTSTGDKFLFAPSTPIDVYRWGILWTVAKDASAMVVTLELRPTIGSDTNRVVSDTISDSAARAAGISSERVFPGSSSTTTTGSDGSTVNVAPGALHVIPGNELVVKVGTAATSTGQGYVFIDYTEYPADPKASGNVNTDYLNVVQM